MEAFWSLDTPMTTSTRSPRWFAWLWIALTLINLAGLLPLKTWPLSDVPNHLAEATIFQQRNTPGSALHDYYTCHIRPTKPAIAHIVICSLFSSVEMGNRVLYGLYIVTLPLLVLRLVTASC